MLPEKIKKAMGCHSVDSMAFFVEWCEPLERCTCVPIVSTVGSRELQATFWPAREYPTGIESGEKERAAELLRLDGSQDHQ